MIVFDDWKRKSKINRAIGKRKEVLREKKIIGIVIILERIRRCKVDRFQTYWIWREIKKKVWNSKKFSIE